MLKQLANIISIAFHPLLMTTFVVGTLYIFAPTAVLPIGHDSVHLFLLMILILTFILPLISVAILKLSKTINSLRLDNRKERLIPFFFITIYYMITTYFFSEKVVLGNTLIVLFTSVTITIFLVSVITTFFKISAHTAGTAGVLGIFVALHYRYIDSLLFWPIVATILLHGLVSSSRLYLQTHDPKEVHFGAALGFLVNFPTVYFFT